ncbi:MAG: hypothetical protein JXR32_09320 [Anaerolineaceae bacterium]|nr:hypothetical protein [Anaerolineaceae bacterium]
MNKLIRYLLIVLSIIGVLVLGFKKNINLEKMNVHETDHFTVYYEVIGQEAIRDVDETLEKNCLIAQEMFSCEKIMGRTGLAGISLLV